MKTNLSLPWYFAIAAGILMLAGFSAIPLLPPHAVSADAPATLFSADRAMTDLAVIAKEPHTAGSDAQQRVREYIVSQTASMSLSAEVQTSGQFSNILVRIPGTNSTGTVLVTGHYDSHAPAPGAGDDGISVAAMLEAIRVLHANPPLQNDVLFLFTDGEEAGWRGASAFIKENPEAKLDSVVLCFDARPGNAPLLLQETSPGDEWLVRQMAGLPVSAWAASWKRDQERNELDYDFDIFQAAGFTGAVFENEASGTRYHTTRDTVDTISPNLVQAYGKTMLALTRRFGSIDLHDRTSGSDWMYVTLPIIGIITYPGWVMSILNGLGILAMLGFMTVGWRRKQFSIGQFVLSVLGLLIGIVLVVVLAQLAWGIIVSNSASEAFSVDAGFESSVKWLSILMAGAVILMILLMSLLDRKLGGISLTLAASILFMVVGLAFYFLNSTNPFTIGWFAWSLIGCVAGFGALLLTRRPAWKLTLLLLSAFLMLTIAVPALLMATYTREDAWLPVLIVSAWAALFAPQVDAIFGRSIKDESTSLIENNKDVVLPAA